MIVLELDGEPRGKGRPRSRVAWTKDYKPFVAVYTDVETRAYEDALAWAAKAAYRGKPLSGALCIAVTAFMGVPKSWSAKKRDAALVGAIRPVGTPDFDNISKVIDALHGIIFENDSQIVDARVIKLYDERPRLRIEVSPLDPLTG